MAISPDGQTIVSDSADKTIEIWNLNAGEAIATLAGDAASVYSVAISPDGRTIASGSADKSLKIWQVQ